MVCEDDDDDADDDDDDDDDVDNNDDDDDDDEEEAISNPVVSDVDTCCDINNVRTRCIVTLRQDVIRYLYMGYISKGYIWWGTTNGW